jgi:hypothetical protein
MSTDTTLIPNLVVSTDHRTVVAFQLLMSFQLATPQTKQTCQPSTSRGCGTKGLESVEGWDPVAGLGTPDFPALPELFMGLP